MKKNITFGTITAVPGTKASGWYSVPGTDYQLPVSVINGSGEGKSILITSAIHGCEYPSIEAVFRLLEMLDPAQLHGQIVLINPVNVNGFLERTPYIIPGDGRNLNRLFPGNPDGELGDRLAWILTEEFQKKVDFYIDTHGGDIPEAQATCVYYPGVGAPQEVLEQSAEAAEYVLHAKYRICSSSRDHAYTYAAIAGTPSVMLEMGECARWTEKEVCLYLENLINLLRYLGVYPGKAEKPSVPARKITEGIYLDAEVSGRWYPAVGKNDALKKGQKIGEIRNFFGEVQEEYFAEFDGEILMVCVALAVQKGNPIIAYGR